MTVAAETVQGLGLVLEKVFIPFSCYKKVIAVFVDVAQRVATNLPLRLILSFDGRVYIPAHLYIYSIPEMVKLILDNPLSVTAFCVFAFPC